MKQKKERKKTTLRSYDNSLLKREGYPFFFHAPPHKTAEKGCRCEAMLRSDIRRNTPKNLQVFGDPARRVIFAFASVILLRKVIFLA